MCGIIGYLAKSRRNLTTFNLAGAISSLEHRGPDDSGLWQEEAVGLGAVRLAVIDLSPMGHQPMLSPDKRYVICFNGEVYNFPDLRKSLESCGETFVGHSDTEVLLRLFVRVGLEETLKQLRGMFSFAVWDRQEKTLSLARDRMGVKPLVYAETTNGFLFGSEIGSLFELDPGLSRRVDHNAIDQYLTYQYVPAPMTGFLAIKKLPPAHAMVVKNGEIRSIFQYWNLADVEPSTLSFKDACEVLKEMVLDATRMRLVSDAPVGAFLSGGVDSSITVAAMARLTSRPVNTYAIGFDDSKFSELHHAQQVADYLGTHHQADTLNSKSIHSLPELISHLGEPFADSSILPTFGVSSLAHKDVKVILTGDGADESFAGYRRHRDIYRVEKLEKLNLLGIWRTLRKATVEIENHFSSKGVRPFPYTRADQSLALKGPDRFHHIISHYTDADKHALISDPFKSQISDHSVSHLALAWEQTEHNQDHLNRWLYVDATTYLPNDVLAKVDIASMAASIECRSPFMDHKVQEFAASLPTAYKLSARGRTKTILKETFKDWFPRGFLERKKMGFSAPMQKWLREDSTVNLSENLLGSPLLRDLFDQPQIANYITDHVSGKKDHTKHLWALLSLSTWARCFNVSN